MNPRRAILAGGILVLAACLSPAPPFPELSPWHAPAPARLAIEDDERAIWDEAKKQVAELIESDERYRDEALETYLASIVSRIRPRIPEAGPKLSVIVAGDSESNAWAIPEGTIVIALPLLARFQNEAELAFVLAHEIAHIVARHSVLGRRYEALTSSFVDRMRLSRVLEQDADREAVSLMALAGYDPSEAARSLTIVVEASPGSEGVQVRAWNSHDELPERLAALRSAIAAIPSPSGARRSDEYQRALDPHRLTAVEIELEAGHFEAAKILLAHHLEREPRSGRAYALRARLVSEEHPEQRLSGPVLADLERAVDFGPTDADSLRALGLALRDTRELTRSRLLLRRYLEARPDAFDRKLVERYLETEQR